MGAETRFRGTTATAHPAALDASPGGVVERYWGLVQHPFRTTPDLEFVYETDQYREALARLLYDVAELGGGLSVLTGESGTGKSTLARALVEALDPARFRAALVVNPLMPVGQLFATILEELGATAPPRRKADQLDAFASLVTALDGGGVEPVLVVDDAHTLGRRHLEELRLLLNFEADDRKLFHLVLVGLPALDARMRAVPGLDDRVTMRCRLGRLADSEGVRYIAHRLRMAGADADVFAPKAAARVVRLAGGMPRRMNLLAGAAMLVAAMRNAAAVSPALVDVAFADLDPEARS
jgi:general secretion pathway protein A